MDYSTSVSQSTDSLASYQLINAVLFIILIVMILAVMSTIIKSGRLKKGKSNDKLNEKFVELEKDYRWRRLKSIYAIITVVIILGVIGVVYGSGAQVPPYANFEIERAADRTGTAFAAIVTTLILWWSYFYILPKLFGLICKSKEYLRNPNKDKNT